jgi:hypothetical protein
MGVLPSREGSGVSTRGPWHYFLNFACMVRIYDRRWHLRADADAQDIGKVSCRLAV